jgi:hypothetical protein
MQPVRSRVRDHSLRVAAFGPDQLARSGELATKPGRCRDLLTDAVDARIATGELGDHTGVC